METKNNIFAFIEEIRIIRILRFTPSGFFFYLMQTFRLYFAKSRALAQTTGLWLDLV